MLDHQSINHSFNQSFIQSIGWSVGQSVSQSINQSINQNKVLGSIRSTCRWVTGLHVKQQQQQQLSEAQCVRLFVSHSYSAWVTLLLFFWHVHIILLPAWTKNSAGSCLYLYPCWYSVYWLLFRRWDLWSEHQHQREGRHPPVMECKCRCSRECHSKLQVTEPFVC